MRTGLLTITAIAAAVATGVVIGEQLRAPADAAPPSGQAASEFRLGQASDRLGAISGAQADGGSPSRSSGMGMVGLIRFAVRIQSIETTHGMLTVLPEGQASAQRLRVSPATMIVRAVPGTGANLRVGDDILVTGVPRELEVGKLRAVQLPSTLLARGNSSAMMGMGRGAGLSGLLQSAGGTADPGGATRLGGRVTSLDPLKIAMSDGLECRLTLKPRAEVTRVVEATVADLRPGDSLVGVGRVEPDNVLTAITVAANLEGSPASRAPRPRLSRGISFPP